ncbi:MAG: RidA family protein [Proteobacteria bacterium]|nr:RidA family protein [Pseudomonadota bacterium]
MNSINKRLEELGINLSTAPVAVANYVPFCFVDHLLMISGQLPMKNGQVAFKGKVGKDLTLEEGQQAARLCALNILTHLQTALEGDWKRLKRCVRLGGFVNCSDDFIDQPKVINGASDLMVEIFGEKGRHARAAVGVNALPLGSAVEVEAVFALYD